MSAHSSVPDDAPLGRGYDARLARRLLVYVRPHRMLVAGAVGCLAVGAGAQLAGPLLTRWVIDEALPAGRAGLVAQAAGFYVALLVMQFLASYGETVVTALLGQRVMRDLRNDVFARLQRLPVAYFDQTPVGRLVTRVTSDVEALNELFTAGVVAGIGDLLTLLAIGVVMVVIDWRLALAAFVVIPAIVLVSRRFQREVRSSFRDIRTRLAMLNAFLGERLAGMRIVQLFGQERREVARFDELNRTHLEAHLRSVTVYALYFPIIEFLTTFALASLLVVAAGTTAGGVASVGTVAAFLQLVRRFFQPLQDLAEKFNILQAAMAAAERLFALLDTPEAEGTAPTPDLTRRAAALRAHGITVAFENVWFAYSGGGIAEDVVHGVASTESSGAPAGKAETEPAWVLRGISFSVSPGQSVALVGHTGAGKSTIVNLLLRFYEPQRGRITINGVDIREMPVDLLRAVMAYVQQDIFLFAGDVASNIRLGAHLDEDGLRHAATRVGADRVIARLPGAWAHELGERGGGISVGERQLLAFARAVAADPALLILDEATSAVDSEVEGDIQRAVAVMMTGRTTIAIAHRLSTVINADEILVLHHGEIVERGTHGALLRAGGRYEHLFRLQAGGDVGQVVGGVRLPTPITAG